MEKVAERFIKYAKQHTTSDPESKTYPSTDKQMVFMKEPVEWIKNPFNNCRQTVAFNSLHRIWQPSADFNFTHC